MSSISIDCPECAQGLTVPVNAVAPLPGTDTVNDRRVGGHLHMQVAAGLLLQCINGHFWRTAGEFLLVRDA